LTTTGRLGNRITQELLEDYRQKNLKETPGPSASRDLLVNPIYPPALAGFQIHLLPKKANGPGFPGPFLEKMIRGSAIILAITVSATASVFVAAPAATAVAAAFAVTIASATSTVAATTSAVTAATSASVAAFTAGRAVLHGACLVDGEVTAAHVGAAEGRNCGLALLRAAEGDESETAGAAGDAIHHDDGVGDGAVGPEDLAEIGLGG
jgi:hypothetical protein